MKKLIVILMILVTTFCSCDILQELEVSTTSEPSLTTDEVIRGLKEALQVGTDNAIGLLSQKDGFYGNSLLKIPFPDEVKVVEEKLRSVGLNKLVDDFIMNMNRGAEQAVKKAGPIFMDAIRGITFSSASSFVIIRLISFSKL